MSKGKATNLSAFVRRGRLVVSAPGFEQVVDLLHAFLWPVTRALVTGRDFEQTWTNTHGWR